MQKIIFLILAACCAYVWQNEKIVKTETAKIESATGADERPPELLEIAPVNEQKKLITPSITANFLQNTEGWERQKALHEAGHFLAAMLLNRRITEVSLIQTDTFGGYILFDLSTKKGEDKLISGAGYAAEMLWFYKSPSIQNYFESAKMNNCKFNKRADLSDELNTDRRKAAQIIINAALFIEKYHVRIHEIAAVFHSYKTLNETECAELINQINTTL
jgi:hypothetical protein